MGFPRHEYWSGLPFHPPGDLPDPGIKPASPVSLALAGRFFATEPPGKPKHITWIPLNTFNHLLASCPLWKQPETLILLDLSHFINLQKRPHLMALEECKVLKPPSPFRKTLSTNLSQTGCQRSRFNPITTAEVPRMLPKGALEQGLPLIPMGPAYSSPGAYTQ